MSRCVESISAKRCGKCFITTDETGGFGGRAALDETADEEAGLSIEEGPFLPPIPAAHSIMKPLPS